MSNRYQFFKVDRASELKTLRLVEIEEMSAVGLCNIHHDGWEIEQPCVRTSGPEAAGS